MDYATHWHTSVEIIMPQENTYTVIVGRVKYILNPGDILMIPAGELHHLIAPSWGTRLILLFDFSVLTRIKGLSYLLSYFSQPTLINSTNYSSIYDKQALLLFKMCSDYFSDDSLRDLLIYSHLLNFFANFGRGYITSKDLSSYNQRDINKQIGLTDKLNTVFNYLDDHFTENITLEKAANIASFSKYHFSRIFKQCSGYNFYSYLCFRRIKSAEVLLLKPGLSITEIALQSGFSSLSTFNRTFKRFKNCTPSEYRNLYSTGMHSL